MDLNKFSALANIGSFFLGCVVLYFMRKRSQKKQRAGEDGVKPVTSAKPLAWVFLGGMVVSGYLHFKAASIQASKPDMSRIESSSVPPGMGTKQERIFVSPDLRQRNNITLPKSEIH
jgi:hypothetical protein